MEAKKVAFYTMTSKGLFVLKKFIEKFGASTVAYIVSARDKSVQYDAYEDICALARHQKIPCYQRSLFDISIEQRFDGMKFAIGWRWLIHSQHNLIVFHDSLLPKYRGFAPLVNSLINEEMRGGVTALFADSKYDSGDILDQKSVEFTYPLKIWDAIRLIEPLYFELLEGIYKKVLHGNSLTGSKQNDEQATYSMWLDELDYCVDWTWSAQKIARFVDAVGYPYSGARARLNGEEVLLKHSGVRQDVHVEHRSRHLGKVIFIDQGIPVVVCAEGLLAISEITTHSGESLQINFRSRFI